MLHFWFMFSQLLLNSELKESRDRYSRFKGIKGYILQSWRDQGIYTPELKRSRDRYSRVEGIKGYILQSWRDQGIDTPELKGSRDRYSWVAGFKGYNLQSLRDQGIDKDELFVCLFMFFVWSANLKWEIAWLRTQNSNKLSNCRV